MESLAVALLIGMLAEMRMKLQTLDKRLNKVETREVPAMKAKARHYIGTVAGLSCGALYLCLHTL